MNYKKLHDSIIFRALSENRKKSPDILYHSHHILPKCEGGSDEGPTVLLTHKEHYLVHKLRHKFTNNLGNFKAYSLMKFGNMSKQFLQQCGSLGAKYHHTVLKEQDPERYSEKQRKAGIGGGNKCVEFKIGFHSQTKEQLKAAQEKGRKTLVENKLGMFSNEFREEFRKSLFKQIYTPEGIFNCMMDAAAHYDMSCGSMTYRVNNKSPKWADWYYIKGKMI